ncbi:MAG: hypothetical protein CVV64_12405 [Candidatus Wallbacteria bacterium HGW-Wallbacteria-1]|jgi:hypothetical protein|uniref:DUF1795 domain-containing protein n=1 Tax=Candidatus Wallbacteria bacterium HGW-Wallbacteria-1 TaxID=2013854 RepID=A0A2N1PNB4_9BACT|nr:MAG: hypothetical protein CVV64_12405 [Candidatus Wallbacteria bacterium HGW-Wallbacteria-1]
MSQRFYGFSILGAILCLVLKLSLPAAAMAGIVEDHLLKARDMEEAARSPQDLTETMRQYQKVFAAARRENNDEMSASALFSIAQIWMGKFSDRARAEKYLSKIIRDFPECSWAHRASEMLDSSGSPAPSASRKMVKGYAFDMNPVDVVHDRKLGLKVSCPGSDWVMTSGRSGSGLYVFAAPRSAIESRFDDADPVPNVSLYASLTETEIEVIDYVNRHQETALKSSLQAYKLINQDIMMLSGKVSVQKTFRFSRHGINFRGMQFYSTRGKLMVVTTYMAPQRDFNDHLAGVKKFVDSIVF